jgi:hypothetical protein
MSICSWRRLCIVLVPSFLFAVAAAQETPIAAPAEGEAQVPQANKPPAGPPLSETQQAIKVRFDRFEDTLFKMARYLQKTEPARAELVLRALGRSKEERVAERMTFISRMLSKEESGSPRYADAIEEQDQILANLRELLTILRSEDILDENRKEQERLKELARQVSALIDAEKVHQAETKRGTPTDRVAKGQERTAKQTGDIIQKIDEHDQAGDAKGEDAKGEDAKGEDAKGEDAKGEDAKGEDAKGTDEKDEEKTGEEQGPDAQKPSEGDQPKEGDDESQKSSKGEGEQSEPKESVSKSKPPTESESPKDSNKGESNPPQEGENSPKNPNEGQPQEGQDSQSKPQDGQQSPPDSSEQSQQQSDQSQTPGREELEQAQQRMEQAIEELQKKNRENASKEQEEAIRKLIEAKERIEELLRQLREEERELLLRSLEARFQKMLQLQEAVLVTSEKLSSLPKEQWSDREFSLCRDAASTEREILIEADKSLEVLRADGSSVAFPEAVEQIAADVHEVASRLGREDAGELTVAIEQDVIEALKEMIQAFQKEMEKLREKKSQQGSQQGSPSEPGLVDKLAELKMLKTLQLRINRRTKTLGKLIEGEQATEPDVVSQLRELADRQSRLQRATYDLATGKTAN